MILPLLASLALADSITLDTGATLEGDLARYEFGGDCQISVTEGGLTGVIVIVPCHRVQTFVRTSVRTPVPIGLETEAEKLSARDDVPVAAQTAAVAAPPVEEVRGNSLAAAPLEEPAVPGGAQDEPFYDEPLFPVDATTPVAPATATAEDPYAAPATSAAPSASTHTSTIPAPSASTHTSTIPAPSSTAYGVVPAPTAMETTGPRLAPRMDDPSPPANAPASHSRSVSF